MNALMENDEYVASPSHNNFLGDCLCIVWFLSSANVSKYSLTDNFIYILIKTKNDINYSDRNANHIIKRSDFESPDTVPLRVMSACLTGLLGDKMCTCHKDMLEYLTKLRDIGEGIFLYLPQEAMGRGIRTKIIDHRMQIGLTPFGEEMGKRSFTETAEELFPGEEFDKRDYSFIRSCFEKTGLALLNYKWLGGIHRMRKFCEETGVSARI